jgi:hypothetical protein
MISMVGIAFRDWFFFPFQYIHLGNGYIEGHELDDLLRELASSVNVSDTNPDVGWFCFSRNSLII